MDGASTPVAVLNKLESNLVPITLNSPIQRHKIRIIYASGGQKDRFSRWFRQAHDHPLATGNVGSRRHKRRPTARRSHHIVHVKLTVVW